MWLKYTYWSGHVDQLVIFLPTVFRNGLNRKMSWVLNVYFHSHQICVDAFKLSWVWNHVENGLKQSCGLDVTEPCTVNSGHLNVRVRWRSAVTQASKMMVFVYDELMENNVDFNIRHSGYFKCLPSLQVTQWLRRRYTLHLLIHKSRRRLGLMENRHCF